MSPINYVYRPISGISRVLVQWGAPNQSTSGDALPNLLQSEIHNATLTPPGSTHSTLQSETRTEAQSTPQNSTQSETQNTPQATFSARDQLYGFPEMQSDVSPRAFHQTVQRLVRENLARNTTPNTFQTPPPPQTNTEMLDEMEKGVADTTLVWSRV